MRVKEYLPVALYLTPTRREFFHNELRAYLREPNTFNMYRIFLYAIPSLDADLEISEALIRLPMNTNIPNIYGSGSVSGGQTK
jgi:hypothetical protein